MQKEMSRCALRSRSTTNSSRQRHTDRDLGAFGAVPIGTRDARASGERAPTGGLGRHGPVRDRGAAPPRLDGMILVDTSVWIAHLHRLETTLRTLLLDDRAATHDGVIQVLALGSLAARDEVPAALGRLTRLPSLRREEFVDFVDRERLWGGGLSAIDVHLLGAARIIVLAHPCARAPPARQRRSLRPLGRSRSVLSATEDLFDLGVDERCSRGA